MRIQHNISALNSNRNLRVNQSALSKNLEKLSSGYRINRAGDDAAGLAISEKMRAQIKGLEQATSNASDAISLVQTAEGALQEVHSMLNRMVTLATQSANGTYDNEVDRKNLQKEIEDLKSEIDRISKSTNFNGINLLDGSLSAGEIVTTDGTASIDTQYTGIVTGGSASAALATTVSGTTSAKTTFTLDLSGVQLDETGTTGNKVRLSIGGQEFTINEDVTFSGTAATDVMTALKNKTVTIAFDDGAGGTDSATFNISYTSGDKITLEADAVGEHSVIEAKLASSGTASVSIDRVAAPRQDGKAAETAIDFSGREGLFFLGGTLKIGDDTYAFVTDPSAASVGTKAVTIAEDSTASEIAEALALTVGTAGEIEIDGVTYTARPDGSKFILTEKGEASIVDPGKVNYKGASAPKLEASGVGLALQIGDSAAGFNRIKVNIGSMDTASLGIDGIDISTQSGAAQAIDKIKNAINKVSSTRGDLGAVQNRLEYTINNLDAAIENTTSAESRIRDTDMAKEMMAYTKNNILTQAAQAMLAQANQLPQGVLQLLQ